MKLGKLFHLQQYQKEKILSDKLKEVQAHLSTEDYKTSLKEMNEDLNKWEDIPCLWIKRFKSAKMVRIPICDTDIRIDISTN